MNHAWRVVPSLVSALPLAGALLLSVAQVPGQTIVQPGAPGQSSKVLTPAQAVTPARRLAAADIGFMQGMIMHHAQAVEMTGLMSARTRNKALLELGKRISISQTDEIEFMKHWLTDRGQSVTMSHPTMAMPVSMKGMDMKSMDMDGMDSGAMPLMPGMLSMQQMKALAKANGIAFDRLFLTGMIQHHNGALTMVEELFNSPGAGQDPTLFDFATDVDNTQRAEIKIMQGMLKEKK